MIETPMDVLDRFPVRRTGKQKRIFRDAVQSYAQGLGYKTKTEQGNLVIGDPETAKYLVTAHYDPPAGLWVPQFLAPCSPVLFVLFQILTVLGLLAPAFLAAGAAAWLGQGKLWYFVLLALLWLTFAVLFFGPANRNNANGNTSGVVTLLETAASMPENLRGRVCFVLLDRGEPAMQGAAFHRKTHPHAVQLQTVLNLDCVGDGDTIVFLPGEGVRRDEKTLDRLIGLERRCGAKRILVRDKGFACFPSDQIRFPRGIGICALRGGKRLYAGRIHTFRDTVLDYTNVNILRACLITFISGAAEE